MAGILTRRGGDYNEILSAARRIVQIACSSDMENKCAKLTIFCFRAGKHYARLHLTRQPPLMAGSRSRASNQLLSKPKPSLTTQKIMD
jgi:hypothetical protein